MAASNVNVVVITGNLTRDPELRTPAAEPRSASCASRSTAGAKTVRRGEWVDKPNYFDVTVWGAQGENCANYLSKGRPVAVEGRLDWREWEAKDGSGKRQAVQIIANSVQFLGSRDGSGGGGGGNGGGGFTPTSDVPADTSDFEGAAAVGGGGGGRRRHSLLAGAPGAPSGALGAICSIPRPNG